MNNEEFLNSLKLLGIEVTYKELSKFEKYKDLLKEYNQKFNLATSRAVSHLKILSELEIPALKINGLFIPLKSHYEEELKETEPFLKTLNSELTEIITYTLPIENSKRTILKITKLKPTPLIYPRNYSQIKKSLNKKQ